jgi:hypothetical protein
VNVGLGRSGWSWPSSVPNRAEMGGLVLLARSGQDATVEGGGRM